MLSGQLVLQFCLLIRIDQAECGNSVDFDRLGSVLEKCQNLNKRSKILERDDADDIVMSSLFVYLNPFFL